MGLNHFIEAQQFDPELLYFLFQRANELREQDDVKHTLNGRILATLFYEPSTRTRLSFEVAMNRLGGRVVTTENAKEFSSAIKGETLEDTIRVVSSYVDGIVLRHHEDGAAERAARVSKVPIINAGDGKGQHPTQALLDLYTIYRETDRVEGLTVACVGDLASGRTARSLSYLLAKFKDNRLVFVSPPHLRIGGDIKTYLDRHCVPFTETNTLEEVLSIVDIVYMTRIQKERISEADYQKAHGTYRIIESNLGLVRPHARILHPLPKTDEIDLPIELENNDPRIAYFRQAENGLYVRMAILDHLLTK